MPGTATGDPHIHRLDGLGFEFRGRPGATYRLLERGDTQIRCTLAALPGMGNDPPRTIIADLTVSVGCVTVAIPLDRQIRVWSPAFDVTVHALLCTLPAHDPASYQHEAAMNSTPYINVSVDRTPDVAEGLSGLMVDGDDSPECEARHRLHG